MTVFRRSDSLFSELKNSLLSLLYPQPLWIHFLFLLLLYIIASDGNEICTSFAAFNLDLDKSEEPARPCNCDMMCEDGGLAYLFTEREKYTAKKRVVV